MRFAVLTATLFFSSQALACGMYIPPEMKVASIGSLMDIVDEEKVEEVDIADGIVAADVEVVPVQAVGFDGLVIAEVADELSRKDRKKARKAQKTAPNS